MQLLGMVRQALHSNRLRSWAIVVTLLATIALISRFFIANPVYFRQLAHINPLVIAIVVLLNVPAMAALIWVYGSLLKLCNVRLAVKENALLTAYSSIANFFGPLQSGPAIRTLYLKTRHKVRVRDYAVATFIYFGIYAFISALFLVVGNRPWWQTILLLLAVASVSFIIIRWASTHLHSREGSAHFTLRRGVLLGLCLATLVQLVCIAAYYYVELRAVNPHIQLGQVISYSGAANFALFVSITPDAIGFREAFLVFSQHFHHISTANILAANIIDRGAYLIFLVLLFLLTLSLHAKQRLHIEDIRREAAPKSSA